MKKINVFLIILLIVCCLSGCSSAGNMEVFNVNEIKLDKENLYIKVGESAELNAQVFPFNAYNQKVYWSSSNKNVAEVDENGKVLAKKVGNAQITATSVDGGLNSKCMVDVMENIMKDYMGSKTIQTKNFLINDNEKSEEINNGTNDIYSIDNVFNSINSIFERQQQLFEQITQQFNNEELLKNMEVDQHIEEEHTTDDGTVVRIKRTTYKKEVD